jgi:hypothetical protein
MVGRKYHGPRSRVNLPDVPFTPTSVVREQPDPGLAHSPEVMAWDSLVRSQGNRMIHYRAMPCPLGVADKDDAMRRVHHQHPGCSRGFLYDRAGEIMVLTSGNSESSEQQDVGALDGSTVSATFARFYEPTDGEQYGGCDAKRAYISPFDRVFLAEESVLWPHWELVEHNVDGLDRLRFPAMTVERLVDSRLTEYREGRDFRLESGVVVWGDRHPAVDPGGRGAVYAVRYLYRPYWYVQRLGHAIRTVQTQDDAAGARKVERLPFQATLIREQVFEESDRPEPGELAGSEAAHAPRDGSAGSK